jgi:hypothetical protein
LRRHTKGNILEHALKNSETGEEESTKKNKLEEIEEEGEIELPE